MHTDRVIFTYSNYQLDPRTVELHKQVCEKLGTGICDYQYLFYNAPDGAVVPDQVIDYGLNQLFQKYKTVLILDIDCVPLRPEALEYTFEQAEKGILTGNVQRSNHIENNKHVYVAPSCMGLTKAMFPQGIPSFRPTVRGDIGEELTYIFEQQGQPFEMYLPRVYQALPYQMDVPWDLNDEMPKYGIGTTFVNCNGMEMYYHLFQSRLKVFDHLFFTKCEELLR